MVCLPAEGGPAPHLVVAGDLVDFLADADPGGGPTHDTEISLAPNCRTRCSLSKLLNPENLMRVFLSHSSLDYVIETALADLLHGLFHVEVDYSSDQASGGGIPPGAKWLQRIEKHIKDAANTYVLLTPNSMNKAWVLWEAGAAAGVVMGAKSGAKSDAAVPVTFGLSAEDIPSPFLKNRLLSRICGQG